MLGLSALEIEEGILIYLHIYINGNVDIFFEVTVS